MAAPNEPTAPFSPAPEGITSEPGNGAASAPAEAITSAPAEETAPAATADGAQAEQPAPPPPAPAKPLFTSPERFVLWRGILDGGLIAVILLLAFEVGFFPVRNSDLLLHRSVGRDIANGTFDFHSDPYAYTTEGATWVDHSWLFGIFAYGMNRLGEWGDTALIILKSLLLAALAELMLRLARRPGQTLWVPALCVGLAVLALSARTLLQPICLSYLFLGLTLFLLEMPRRSLAAKDPGVPMPVWNVRWLIVPLCALWVNLDAWFLLGPILVGLYLIGELLEGAKAPRGSVANLGMVLAASVVACLANPYHVYAFVLPDQLGLSPAARELERLLAGTLVGPWQSDYLNSPNTTAIYRSVAGLAYYPLVFGSLASFIRLPGSWRNWRSPVWLAFFLLSSWHARAIPFFAVVAGPIMSLNLLDYNALVAAAGVPEDVERRRRLLSMRVLTLLIGIAAFTAGSAGWLHSPLWGPDLSGDSRRPGWWDDFDTTLANAARQMADWRERKLVSDDVRSFNTSLDAINYLAWYAPGVRGFIDNRFSLYPEQVARDFRAGRDALMRSGRAPEGAAGQAEDEGWGPIFNAYKVGYVLVGEGDVSRRGLRLIPTILLQPEEWTPCFLFGGAAIFGWNKASEQGAAKYAPIRYDASRLAFGPKGVAETAPDKRPTPLLDPTWYEIIWQPERPRSSETDNAYIHLVAYQAQDDQRRQRAEYESRMAATGQIFTSGFPFATPAATYINEVFSNLGAAHDPGPPADLYLAIRAARRALQANPENSRAWFLLGNAYYVLSNTYRERSVLNSDPAARSIRQAQMVAALTQAVRYSPEFSPDLGKARELLAALLQGWYDDLAQRKNDEPPRFVDLVARHLEGARKVLLAEVTAQTARGENNASLEANKQHLQALDQEVLRLQGAKKDQEDRFELDSANKSALERAQLALRYGLVETALKACREHVQQMNDGSVERNAAGPGLDLTLRLLMVTGELDEARLLVQAEAGRELLKRTPDRTSPAGPQGADDWFRIQIDAASGDYAEADETLKDLLTTASKTDLSAIVAAGLGDQLLLESAEAGRVTGLTARWIYLLRRMGKVPDAIPTYQAAVQFCMENLNREAELQTLRGWLALEAGDTETARTELTAVSKRAAAPHSPIRGYRSRQLATTLLGWIDANAKP